MGPLILHHALTNSEKWSEQINIKDPWLAELAELTLNQILGVYPPCELSFLWTDNVTIQHYNRDFRSKDQPTNVLSFPSYTKEELSSFLKAPPFLPLPLGDLVFAYETVEGEATQEGKLFQHHISHLIVHGLLHLLGYDHEEESEAILMERKEIAILAQKAIPNPYRSWQN